MPAQTKLKAYGSARSTLLSDPTQCPMKFLDHHSHFLGVSRVDNNHQMYTNPDSYIYPRILLFHRRLSLLDPIIRLFALVNLCSPRLEP